MVLVIGLAMAACTAVWFHQPTLAVSDVTILGVVCLEILTHTLPRRLLAFGGSVESITLDEVLFVPMLLVLDPTQITATALVASVAGSIVVRRTPVKSVFNAGQYVGSCVLGYVAYHAIAGDYAASVNFVSLAAASVGTLVVAVASRLSVATIIAYATGLPLRSTIIISPSHVFAWCGAASLGVTGSAVAFTYESWGFVPALLLVAFVQRAFAAQIQEEGARVQAERLQRHTAALRQTAHRSAIEASVTASAVELVGGRTASVLEPDEDVPPGALAVPMANGQQLVVEGRMGPGTWSVQERETLTTLAGVAADTLRSSDLISHLRNITDGQSEAVLAIDATGLITFANPAAVRLLGSGSVDETLGTPVSRTCRLQVDEEQQLDLVALAHARWTADDADAVLPSGPRDEPLHVSFSFTALTEDDVVTGAVLVMRDVSERRAFQVAMTHLAMHDELTGLPNRRSFLERLDALLDQAAPCAVVFVNLDRFKLVNDSFGHLVGDRLLVSVGNRLAPHAGTGGITARLSGDEFVLLLTDTDESDAREVVDALVTDLREPYMIDRHVIFITVSLGVATAALDQKRDDVLLAADAAVHAAKAAGRDCTRYATSELVAATRERLETESRLRQAIDEGALHLDYQPIIDTKTRRMVSVEALVRWHRDERTVPPDQFIPLAEESGLIVYLGRWVLEEACRTTHRWNTAFPDRVPITVSVNLSALQLAQPRLAPEVADVLERTGLPAGLLTLEITETAVLSDIEANLPTLTELRQLGVHLSVDDFGTGYSSLAYLRQLPVDVVKLDASFIAGLGHDAVDTQIVAAVLRLCKALGHQVVAEGVETEVQRQTLAHMGSPFMQGYLLARPMPAAAFEHYWDEMYAGRRLLGTGPGPA